MFKLLKLKPPHGWNAVAWELGIVTLGVLIALAAQQIVETWHWQKYQCVPAGAPAPELKPVQGFLDRVCKPLLAPDRSQLR